jgi:hypothetical protein
MSRATIQSRSAFMPGRAAAPYPAPTVLMGNYKGSAATLRLLGFDLRRHDDSGQRCNHNPGGQKTLC